MLLLALALHAPVEAAEPRHLGLVAKALALTEGEGRKLVQGQMMVLDQDMGTYIGGYREIYRQDLPLLVTADSLNFPLHQIFLDQIVAEEAGILLPDLVAALRAMEAAALPDALPEQVRMDVHLHLCVALALATQPDEARLEAGCADEAVTAKARAILGVLRDGWLNDREVWSGGSAGPPVPVNLQGRDRVLDPSAFVPAAPYTDEEGQRWFRAVTWLREGAFGFGREAEGGGLEVDRRAALGALTLSGLAAEPEIAARWAPVRRWVRGVYGEPDGADPESLGAWMAGRDVATLAESSGWERDLAASELGLVVSGVELGAGPGLLQRFSLLPPALAVDSAILGGLAPVGARPELAALLGALGNASAFSWVPEPQRTRAAVWARDLRQLPPEHWTGSLRDRWLDAVRALADGRAGARPGPWAGDLGARRTAMLQLSTWTLLRHDTRLFAPYANEGGCSFPEVLVEPYPAFYEALAGIAGAMRELLAQRAEAELLAHLSEVERTLLRLRDIALAQAGPAPLAAADQRWLQGAVSFQPAGEYEGDAIDGWYPSLYWPKPEITLTDQAVNWERVVVDVYVRPPDEDFGGEVLHVGTGAVRPLLVVAPSCEGPVVAVGPTQDIHALWTPGMARMSDAAWTGRLSPEYGSDQPPLDPGHPAWLAPLFAPGR